MIVIAAPAVAAAGLGYGVYRVARRLRGEDDSGQRPAPTTGPPVAGLADEDLSIAPIDAIDFRDIAADSGQIVQVSEGTSQDVGEVDGPEADHDAGGAGTLS